ncbi:hypothetical protein Cus16_2776 [Curtobacterium sp. ER1/6]|nr:hypothetical protein Cus16_2776 [Curtobacterium sp. ER1/6]
MTDLARSDTPDDRPPCSHRGASSGQDVPLTSAEWASSVTLDVERDGFGPDGAAGQAARRRTGGAVPAGTAPPVRRRCASRGWRAPR